MKRTKAPLRRTRLRRVSAKRAEQNKEYLRLRAAFLKEHPYCQIYLRVFALNEADAIASNGWIGSEAGLGGTIVVPRATDIHHTKGRGKYLLATATWMAASRWWHRWAHDNPQRAYELGIMQDRR